MTGARRSSWWSLNVVTVRAAASSKLHAQMVARGSQSRPHSVQVSQPNGAPHDGHAQRWAIQGSSARQRSQISSSG